MTGHSLSVSDRRARSSRAERARHLLIAGVIVGLGLGAVALAQSLPVSTVPTAFAPQWWPTTLGVLLVALGALLALRRSEHEPEASEGGAARMLAVLATAVMGVAVWQVIGFVPAMAAMTAALLLVLGERRVLVTIALPLIVTALLYGFFALLLRVPL